MTEQITQGNEIELLSGTANPSTFSYPENLKSGTQPSFSFSDIFYSVVSIKPLAIDVGNIASPQSFVIDIFNGLMTSVTLESIDTTNAEGITITNGPSRPYVLAPLEELTYTVTVLLEGPVTIDAELLFNFTDDTLNSTLTIVGSRIVAFPFFFKEGSRETFTWSTSTLTSTDGTEQRSRILKIPRRDFESTAVMRSETKALADNLLFGWRTMNWAMPIWNELRFPTTAITDGQTVIDVDTTNSSFKQLGLVMVWDTEYNYEVFIISDITASTITIDKPTTLNYVNPIVLPISLSTILANPSRSTTGDNGFMSIVFRSTDNTDIENPTLPPQYQSYDVADFEALLNGEYVEDVYNSRVEFIDFNTGPFETYAPWKNTKTSRSFRIILDGQDEIWEFKEWLHRRAGKWRPFWMQNYEQSYRLIDTGGAIASSFTCENDEQATQGADKSHVSAVLKNGTIINAEIVSKNLDSENNVVIGLDTALNVEFSEIDYITNLSLKRLGSDKITIVYFQNNVAECVIPIVEVNP